jgi:hypothetical protein
MTAHAHYWTVYAGTRKERARNDFDLAWKAIFRRFVVRSAAEQFAALAAKQMPEARIEVRATVRDDGIRL